MRHLPSVMNLVGDFVTGGQCDWTDKQTAVTQRGERITFGNTHHSDNFAAD
jgi:hypothetical protein